MRATLADQTGQGLVAISKARMGAGAPQQNRLIDQEVITTRLTNPIRTALRQSAFHVRMIKGAGTSLRAF